MIIGRFAPSPTGPLHTGSLVAAVGSWLMAKSAGGQWLLRIDDLDGPRCRQEFEDDILRTLERFGLSWDGAITRQSDNTEAYAEAFEQLRKLGAVYPCGCSRAEIARSASAPHPGEEIAYPGTCRSGLLVGRKPRAWRLRTDGVQIAFDDLRHGRITTELDRTGDFVVKRAEGFFAYQLAVVVDDQLTGVNQVVRGDDLLDSTPRQVLIHQLLGWPLPQYCHLPLVTGPDGAKLSKRDNTVSLADGRMVGKESELLRWSFQFLGLVIPAELVEASSGELLHWAQSQPSDFWLKRKAKA
ncbi:MAG: tRNA glutamyl-Q(34) synthetase GluQRS [Trichlorobacter sp.]|uniref:tRNA glutamyl-Q(34) synthetase GluQRS n=1 Tax=Trichlorobacter sp. TaxID=2911007 RepID=UPI00255DC355|nr:tRNA glutamyl-Q(34) synthetase GluQRS [Trichlorobacter sp.]MDK9717509.1 tRNA glutamyl-Q(34) synthetase GluQRS [Trichlorobacter sp.]